MSLCFFCRFQLKWSSGCLEVSAEELNIIEKDTSACPALQHPHQFTEIRKRIVVLLFQLFVHATTTIEDSTLAKQFLDSAGDQCFMKQI